MYNSNLLINSSIAQDTVTIQKVNIDYSDLDSVDVNQIVNDYQNTISNPDQSTTQTIQNTISSSMNNMFNLNKLNLTQSQKLIICSIIVVIVAVNLVRAGSAGIRIFGFLSLILAVFFLLYQIMSL